MYWCYRCRSEVTPSNNLGRCPNCHAALDHTANLWGVFEPQKKAGLGSLFTPLLVIVGMALIYELIFKSYEWLYSKTDSVAINTIITIIVFLIAAAIYRGVRRFRIGSQSPAVKQENDSITDLRAKAYRGDAEAQYNLGSWYEYGFCYEYGFPVPQDYAEAVKLYRKAADQGHAKAQCILGLHYTLGQGVPQDVAEAYVWTSLSAANGYTEASEIRDRAAQELSRQALEQAQARVRELQAEIQARIEKK